MNEYCKMRSVNSPKSRSMDFSDHFSPPQTPKSMTDPNPTPISNNPTPTSKTPNSIETNNNNNNNNNNNMKPNTTHDLSPSIEQEDVVGERFGVILTRNCSVSSTPSQKYRADQKQNKALQAAVVRAFSMRRSASVSEGYSRIHDQSDPFSSPTNDSNMNNLQTKSKKKKKNKILKACRSFFGL
ncbi:hypothetical protein BVC80_8469g3 [Macleaya cordata]|uniref:Uncharacterized protein n=1 Tax=Macleaya cordata TaxID=56857 RepID=A0A200PZL3_MACCD|nr:hypothetical protein BVC80_8469g3 [Macleaya cordata]